MLTTEVGKTRPFDQPEEEAFLNLARTAAILSHQFDRLFKLRGLSEATYNILRIVRGHGRLAKRRRTRFAGVPCSVIARQLVTPVPDLTRLIDRLVRDGRVTRTRSADDRRVVLVDLTEAGRRLLDDLNRPVRDLHRDQLGHLSKRDLGTLSRLLEKARAPHLESE